MTLRHIILFSLILILASYYILYFSAKSSVCFRLLFFTIFFPHVRAMMTWDAFPFFIITPQHYLFETLAFIFINIATIAEIYIFISLTLHYYAFFFLTIFFFIIYFLFSSYIYIYEIFSFVFFSSAAIRLFAAAAFYTLLSFCHDIIFRYIFSFSRFYA